ncbi:MAG: glycosyltransferase [Prevotella sp.]|nr:glycosyltransferase [Prevotella sp.]
MLSIIIPVYNAEKYLRECIDSVLKQNDFDDFELICVDDGSTDSSLEILNSYSDSRLRILTQRNQGAGVARNKGIDIAQGDYIMFLDSDDYMTCGTNTLRAYKLAQDKKLDILLTAADFITEEGEKMWTITPTSPITSANGITLSNIDTTTQYTPEEWGDAIFIAGTTAPHEKIIRRDFINNNNLRFLTLKRSEDFPFVQLSLITATHIGICNISLNKVRVVSTSLEHTKDQTPLIFHEAETQYYAEIYKRGLTKWLRASHINSMQRVWGNLMSMQTYEGMDMVYNRLPELYKLHHVDVPEDSPVYNRYESARKNIEQAISFGNAGEWLMYRMKKQEEAFTEQLKNKDEQQKKLWDEINTYNSRPIIKLYNHLSSIYHKFFLQSKQNRQEEGGRNNIIHSCIKDLSFSLQKLPHTDISNTMKLDKKK